MDTETHIISMKGGVLSRSHSDNYFVGTDTFLCNQKKSGILLTIVIYIDVHIQDKPLPAGTLDWMKHPISKILFLTFRFCVH